MKDILVSISAFLGILTGAWVIYMTTDIVYGEFGNQNIITFEKWKALYKGVMQMISRITCLFWKLFTRRK